MTMWHRNDVFFWLIIFVFFEVAVETVKQSNCPPLKRPLNGQSDRCHNTSCPINSHVHFWCDQGYQLHGNTFAGCTISKNGSQWSAKAPECVLDPSFCPKMSQPAEAYPLSACATTACPVGTVVLMACRENFEPITTSRITCIRPYLTPAEWDAMASCIPLTEESGRSRNSGRRRKLVSDEYFPPKAKLN